MIQFYAPDIETTLTLPESDSQHCVRVLRMTVGDEIRVVDGRGTAFRCRLLDNHPKHTAVEIVARENIPLAWPNRITVMVAPTKHNDRMEWLVEKLVEVGVNHIIPIRCHNSERREIKRERLERIAVSAMKQSLKATLPDIDQMTDIAKATARYDATTKFVGYCDAETERAVMARCYQPGRDTIILIGPEGDFTSDEIAMLIERGYRPVTMGDNRLRTETAALVAVDTCHILNQAAALEAPDGYVQLAPADS